jgi:foldase protein PrsA
MLPTRTYSARPARRNSEEASELGVLARRPARQYLQNASHSTDRILMRVNHHKKIWIALGAIILSSIASAQIDPNKTIATINGDPVKGAEYYRRMEFLPGVGKMDNQAFFEAPPGFLTLEQLITERLVVQLAKQKGVFPSDAEVEAELKIRQEDDPNLVQNWTTNGHTMEELKKQVEYDLAQFKLQTQGVTVTDSEVQKFYNDNPSMYTNPKQVKLRVIVVLKEADKAPVDKDLAAGKPFADVAKQYSVDASKAVGGEFGTVPIAFLNTPAKTAVEAVKIGQATAWVQSQTQDNQSRFVKFFLEDVIAEKKMTFDAKLKRQIRQRLMVDRGNVKNDVRKEMNVMRSKAKIEITEPEFADIYKKFVDAYLKQGG